MKALPKAILFDADGTLYDSERLHYAATRQVAQELHDFDFSWELYLAEMIRGSKSGAEVLTAHGFDTEDQDYHKRKQHIFGQLVTEKLTVLPGASEFLAWCKEYGILRLVVTSSRRSQVEAALAAVGLQAAIDVIVSKEDTRPNPKPHPFPFEEGLRLADVKVSDAIAVEDTAKGIASAHAAGLWCAGMRNDVNNAAELSQADLRVDDYWQLQNYLTS